MQYHEIERLCNGISWGFGTNAKCEMPNAKCEMQLEILCKCKCSRTRTLGKLEVEIGIGIGIGIGIDFGLCFYVCAFVHSALLYR